MKRKRDYLFTIEFLHNQYATSDLYKTYKIILVRGCTTLHEANTKLYEKLHLEKSKWEIVKVEKLKAILEIVE